jgi:hypothetical protein
MVNLTELKEISNNPDLENLPDGNDDDIKTLELSTYSKTAWLQEVVFFGTNILIIGVSLIIALISIMAKAVWMDVFIRTGASILILGFLGWVINWLFGKYIITAKFQELKEQASEEEEHSVEFSA